ncbi:RGCVC family protein [Actinosynnema sp. ALI-1.44]|uniref:RGCVC family protein n=1 Tax=Actinosynnema sp. ALI-1.44 TaxID=1933779 RepID=UPI000A077B56|nr:RGCVC family protein [Actinosynnema sp. ALI-1.44]
MNNRVDGPIPITADAKPIVSEPGIDIICLVCPHPWNAHDPIGIRFCNATAAAGHDRGCVCSADAGVSPSQRLSHRAPCSGDHHWLG